MHRFFFFILLFSLLFWGSEVFPKKEHQHALTPMEIGIDEKLGEYVPLDLTFVDERGNPLQLRELINKPTIVSLVYYRCLSICPRVLSGVAEVLDKLGMEPGEDYNVITLSFDETDSPKESLRKKRNYVTSFEKPFPEEAWRFLTGEKENIRRFTDALGFHFKREGEGFVHPASVIILSPHGKVVRYLRGVQFLPFDMKMALLEASEGRVGPTISRVLLYCFSYDPKGKKYVFNILKVSAAVIIIFMIALFAYLALRRRTPKAK